MRQTNLKFGLARHFTFKVGFGGRFADPRWQAGEDPGGETDSTSIVARCRWCRGLSAHQMTACQTQTGPHSIRSPDDVPESQLSFSDAKIQCHCTVCP